MPVSVSAPLNTFTGVVFGKFILGEKPNWCDVCLGAGSRCCAFQSPVIQYDPIPFPLCYMDAPYAVHDGEIIMTGVMVGVGGGVGACRCCSVHLGSVMQIRLQPFRITTHLPSRSHNLYASLSHLIRLLVLPLVHQAVSEAVCYIACSTVAQDVEQVVLLAKGRRFDPQSPPFCVLKTSVRYINTEHLPSSLKMKRVRLDALCIFFASQQLSSLLSLLHTLSSSLSLSASFFSFSHTLSFEFPVARPLFCVCLAFVLG